MASDTADQAAEAAQLYEDAMASKEEGTNLYKQQRYEEALQAWRRALLQLPSGQEASLARLVVSLHLNISQAALQLGRHQEVVTHATQALKLDRESSKALYRRALALDALGRVREAVVDLRAAAHLEPRSAEIRTKFEECKKKGMALAQKDADDERPPEHDLEALPRVFLDIAVGEAAVERFVFALYTDTAPRTAENFRKLCTGGHEGLTARGKRFHYKGSILHRMIPGLMVQGGDFENANGTGGESIYGRRFDDETFVDRHTRRGLLAMANDGPNTNGSNFFVSLGAAEHLDKHHVIFGELVEGSELLDRLEQLPVDAENRPLQDCVIRDCGELSKEA